MWRFARATKQIQQTAAKIQKLAEKKVFAYSADMTNGEFLMKTFIVVLCVLIVFCLVFFFASSVKRTVPDALMIRF
jgi:hypothetical protein